MLGKHRFKIIFCTVFLLGSGFWLYGALDDGHLDLVDMRGLGALLLVMLMLGAVAARSVVSERVVERTRLTSYDEGFEAGCAATGRSHGLGSLTLLRPPQQFAQEEDVGRSADRIG